MSSKNVMGLDKYMMTAIRSYYRAISPLIKQRDKLQKSVDEINEKLENIKEQIKITDSVTRALTEKQCGVALSSEEVLYYEEHPDEFTDDFPQTSTEKLNESELEDTENN